MSWQVGHPIKRDGTSQSQRLPTALPPELYPIDARRREELLLFIYQMARQFAYYNAANQVEGDWESFFDDLKDESGTVSIDSIKSYLTRVEQKQDNATFTTLILAFIKIFGYVQQDINSLSKKHLDFYYEKLLGFRRLAARPDTVHILFELSPQLDFHRIPAGTALKAGNDALGNPLTYITNREIVANKAKLAAIKTTLIAQEKSGGKIYAAEVADSADGLGAPLDGEPKRWPTFGHPAQMQVSTVGFAIASPLLLLKSGRRIISLTLGLEDIPEDLTESDLASLIPYGSGEEAWIELLMNKQGTIDRLEKTLRFEIVARPELPPVLAYNKAVLSGNLHTGFPVLKLLLGPESLAYNQFKTLRIKEIRLKVEVIANKDQAGIQELVIKNDSGSLDPEGAFQPFGAEPSKGALFFIGSQEVFSKPLDKLNLQLRWADLPDIPSGFAGHYAKYDDVYRGNSKFRVDFQVLSNRQWSGVFARNSFLFEPVNNGELIPDVTLEIENSKLQSLPLNADLQLLEELESTAVQGFIRLSLTQDFGHRVYTQIFAEEVVGSGDFPNLPYTPTLQALSLGYTASQKINLREELTNAQFFHIQPFGSESFPPQASIPLLPQMTRGALYLGFEDLEPPQNLHLLFQMAEGSAISTQIIERENIAWDYLTDMGWRKTPLEGSEIFIDTTLGLKRSGIMAFSIGRDATLKGGLLPAGMHWLRATVSIDPNGAANCVNIHPQATTAVFVDKDNAPSHLLQALPAERIAALVERDSAIRKVEQPYASFGGSPAEPDNFFYTRISERLRHKQRAITLWDIDRLVLQQFPSLYEVKTIPHTGYEVKTIPHTDLIQHRFYSEFLPGQVTVVVIPQLRNQNAVNPLQPKASVALLQEVKQYLAPLMTHFVGAGKKALHIISPFYEPIQLSFSVGFREGFDAGFYAVLLNDSLRRHLSPWAFEEGEDIRFGGKLYKSQLLAFAEEQEYVDYVTDFKMLHGNTGPGIGEMCVDIDFTVRSNAFGEEVDIAEASTAASILVSADHHHINVLEPETFPCDEPEICIEGVGCWFIDIDFVVS